MEKKINIGKNGKVKIIWNLSSMDYTAENEKNIKSVFAEKYNISPSSIIIEKNFKNKNNQEDNTLNYENIKNISDTNFQLELMKQYLKENEIEDYDFEEIKKIDSIINNLVNYDLYEKGKLYKIKWVRWSNFLSYGPDNYFDFTKLHNLVLLKGIPSNKSGKSTFAYDLLHFLFFGKTKSGKANNNLGKFFNIFLPEEKELFVEGCINIDGTDYVIKRTLTRAGKSKKELRTATQKIEYYRINDVGDREELADIDNLQEESSTKTNKIIKEALGDEKDFDLIISANAQDLDALISLKTDERGKILSRWIGLSCLQDKDAIAREMWNKKISVGRYSDIYNRETLKQEIEALNNENNENELYIDANKSKINDCENRLKTYKEDKERYQSDKKPIDDSVKNIKYDVTTLETMIKNIVELGKRESEQKEELKKQFNTITDFEYSDDEYKQLTIEKETLIEEISTLKVKIQSLKENNKYLKESEYCPTCGRKFDNVDNSALIQTNEQEITKLINIGIEKNKIKEEVTNSIFQIEERRKRKDERNKLELKILALETKLSNERVEYKELRDNIKKINDNKDAIRYNDELDAKIKTANDSISAEENVKQKLSNDIATLKNEIKSNKEKISEKEAIIVKINNEEKIEKNWKLYLKLIGKDGISKIVLRNTLPLINAEINNLLSDVCDFSVEVIMNDKNDVEFYMIRDDKKYDLTAASGLERTQAALALRVVIGNMSRLSRPPFVLLDEILGGVAKENYDDMRKLYKKITTYFDFILHITHIDIDDWHDGGTILVEKINNISKISFN